MLDHVAIGFNRVTLDDLIMHATAKEQSGTFFLDNPPPVFVDEIQKVPALFEQFKLYLDGNKQKGQFYLCGSQQFRMMKSVSESLAGRVGLITLLGFSMRERQGVIFDQPFIPTEEYFAARKAEQIDVGYSDVWNMIHHGSIPELAGNPDYYWRLFYSAYVNTYIERDAKELSEIGDTIKFTSFTTETAASVGQLLNLTSLARDVGISVPTAER